MQLSPTDCDDVEIRNEISQLKQRLAGTDQELQRTNHTLRFEFRRFYRFEIEFCYLIDLKWNCVTFIDLKFNYFMFVIQIAASKLLSFFEDNLKKYLGLGV